MNKGLSILKDNNSQTTISNNTKYIIYNSNRIQQLKEIQDFNTLFLVDLSGNHDETRIILNDLSGNHDETFRILNDLSGEHDFTRIILNDLSANHDATFEKLNDLSGEHDFTRIALNDLSGNHTLTREILNDLSGEHDFTRIALNDLSGNHTLTREILNDLSTNHYSLDLRVIELEEEDFITTAIADGRYVNNNGDTMIGALTIQKQNDGDTLLLFDTEREWRFKQNGSGASARLTLQSDIGDKYFDIRGSKGDIAVQFYASENAPTPTTETVVTTGRIVAGAFKEGGELLEEKYALSSHTHTASDITSGTFDVDRIPDLAISKITGLQSELNNKLETGDFNTFALDGNSILTSDVPNLDTSKITTGTFAVARIPNLAISKITGLQTSLDEKLETTDVNTFSLDGNNILTTDIPSLDASKITSGTFAVARIPNLSISKITGLHTELDGKLDLTGGTLDNGAITNLTLKASNGTHGTNIGHININTKWSRESGFRLTNYDDETKQWLIGRKYNGGSTDSNLNFLYKDGTYTTACTITPTGRIVAGSLVTTGNVGIGTTSPDYKLDVNGGGDIARFAGTSANYLFKSNSTSGYTTEFLMDNNGLHITGNSFSRMITLATGNVERLRVSGSGGVSIGTEADPPVNTKLMVGGRLELQGDVDEDELIRINPIVGFGYIQYCIDDTKIFQAGTGGATNAEFYFIKGNRDNKFALIITRAGGVQISQYTTNGTVSTSGGNGTIVVSSDRRLKTDISYLDTEDYRRKAYEDIQQFKPATFKWKQGDDNTVLGFIAQDVEETQLGCLCVDGKKFEYDFVYEYDEIEKEVVRYVEKIVEEEVEKEVEREIEVIDESGNVVLDESGNPVMTVSMETITETIKKTIGEPITETVLEIDRESKRVKLDASGNPVLDYEKPRYRGLEDKGLIAINTLVIQQLIKDNERLEAKVEQLEAENQQLKQQVVSFEERLGLLETLLNG